MPKQIEDKKKILVRVKKIQGQVQAIERALEGDTPCAAILQQICAIRGAMNGLMTELLEVHLKDTLVAGESTEQQRHDELSDISKILKSYLK
ncbi:metal/formaldehyde-sensitive transcriptional repressor [Acinetobacter puyangensis]|uniref:DNA-binding transcriptional regulator, FrmR family n=1 Tax=Acinetobacter puyangensis TaxID=1096779 RepID=A0A240EBQ4_9GAMM|nr:metal/formaldehyde-sensitive transcriptional repressor [Acinetobacter puyangensis]SNX45971.1 DNA-binding transcriptional regulator, FrmR family [Acinetobacter puyangensis]